MKILFVRIENKEDSTTLTLYLVPPPLFEMRKTIGIAAHLLGKDSVEFLNVFNKTTSAAESIITFVMLHNTDTKCEWYKVHYI